MKRFLKENSSVIMTFGAAAGVITTAYLSARAGHRHALIMSEKDPYMTRQEEAAHVWRLYVPAATAGAATIVCLAGVKRVDGKKTLAAQAALEVSRRAYEGYREEVVREYGERKDSEILARRAQAEVNDKAKPAIIVGSGDVLCFEVYTGRYFKSDMQRLDRAVNEINARMLKHDYATLDDWYYEIGLEYTSVSGQTGWKSSKLLELEFSTVLHEGEPCLAFEYNYIVGL